MQTIEAIKITMSFGHYDRVVIVKDEGPTEIFMPEYTYDHELSSSMGCISKQVAQFRKEVEKVVGQNFGKFIIDYNKKKEIPHGDRSRKIL